MPLENNRWVKREGIVAIVDLDKSTISHVTRKFLKKREDEGRLMTSSTGIPKSFLVYDDGLREEARLSVFSPDVLKKRMEN